MNINCYHMTQRIRSCFQPFMCDIYFLSSMTSHVANVNNTYLCCGQIGYIWLRGSVQYGFSIQYILVQYLSILYITLYNNLLLSFDVVNM